jgi:hypothetical protein
MKSVEVRSCISNNHVWGTVPAGFQLSHPKKYEIIAQERPIIKKINEGKLNFKAR